MSTLRYVTSRPVAQIEDRTLAHLQILTATGRPPHPLARTRRGQRRPPGCTFWLISQPSNGGLWIVPEPQIPEHPAAGKVAVNWFRRAARLRTRPQPCPLLTYIWPRCTCHPQSDRPQMDDNPAAVWSADTPMHEIY